jgi:hypothetical protein
VAVGASGDFVVAWDEFGSDGDDQGVFGQQFDAAGAPMGEAFQINSTIVDDQMFPFAAATATGQFLVVWDSFAQDGDGHGLMAQRLGIPITTGMLSGWVYVDVNNNGVKDPPEVGLPNVPITAIGPITVTVLTDSNGYYEFSNLPVGDYTIKQVQPGAFIDGIDSLGLPPGGVAANNQFVDVPMFAQMEATSYNFGERGLIAELVGKHLFLASTPPAEQLVGQFTFDARQGVSFHADGEATLTARLAETNASARLELYSTGMRPVVLSESDQLEATLQAGQRYFLFVADADQADEVDVSVQLRGAEGEIWGAGPLDVNHDGFISTRDVLLIINRLNGLNTSAPLPGGDVNRDGLLTTRDALLIINHLNRPLPVGEAVLATEADVTERPSRLRMSSTVAIDAAFLDMAWLS